MASPSPSKASSQHLFQPPTGTRDFFPADMRVRRYIEKVWREVSIAHGFEEIEGPNFEHLELYTTKSGEGIVSELFSFQRAGGETTYALRPEFTPTLARMVAANANALPRPIKWFCIPSHYRAERPQRGRLREFVQWNVDIVGDDSPAGDAEIIAVAVGVLEQFGLTPNEVKIRISDRCVVSDIIRKCGGTDIDAIMALLDKRAKMEHAAFQRATEELGFNVKGFDDRTCGLSELARSGGREIGAGRLPIGGPSYDTIEWNRLRDVHDILSQQEYNDWIDIDFSIVRGLAYYTGTVFEIHRVDREERAVAGGGRYDNLIELFGGPPIPACGFAMGDAVIRLMLEDRNLLPDDAALLEELSRAPVSLRPDVFVISNGSDRAEAELKPLVARLRRMPRNDNGDNPDGASDRRDPPLHVRHSYKATRNVGKLLGEAGKQHARFAVILGDELAQGNVAIKNLDSGDQQEAPFEGLEGHLRQLVREARV